MNTFEMKQVHVALRMNLDLYVQSKGESLQVGTENFTEKQCELFDEHFDYEVNRINRSH